MVLVCLSPCGPLVKNWMTSPNGDEGCRALLGRLALPRYVVMLALPVTHLPNSCGSVSETQQVKIQVNSRPYYTIDLVT